MDRSILHKMARTRISGQRSKKLLGQAIREAFDNAKGNKTRSEEMLMLAYVYQVPQLDEMMSDYEFEFEL